MSLHYYITNLTDEDNEKHGYDCLEYWFEGDLRLPHSGGSTAFSWGGRGKYCWFCRISIPNIDFIYQRLVFKSNIGGGYEMPSAF